MSVTVSCRDRTSGAILAPCVVDAEGGVSGVTRAKGGAATLFVQRKEKILLHAYYGGYATATKAVRLQQGEDEVETFVDMGEKDSAARFSVSKTKGPVRKKSSLCIYVHFTPKETVTFSFIFINNFSGLKSRKKPIYFHLKSYGSTWEGRFLSHTFCYHGLTLFLQTS